MFFTNELPIISNTRFPRFFDKTDKSVYRELVRAHSHVVVALARFTPRSSTSYSLPRTHLREWSDSDPRPHSLSVRFSVCSFPKLAHIFAISLTPNRVLRTLVSFRESSILSLLVSNLLSRFFDGWNSWNRRFHSVSSASVWFTSFILLTSFHFVSSFSL